MSHHKTGSGGPRRIRTPDPLIRSQVLYPAELSVHGARDTLGGSALQGQTSGDCGLLADGQKDAEDSALI